MSEVKSPASSVSERDIFKFLDDQILELKETISYKHLKKILLDKFGDEEFSKYKAKIKEKIASYVDAINKQHSSSAPCIGSHPIQIRSSVPVATATDESLMRSMKTRHQQTQSHASLPASSSRSAVQNLIQRSATGPRDYVESLASSVSIHSPAADFNPITPRDDGSFQQIKVKKKSLFAKSKKKDGVLFCKLNNLPAILSEPDLYFVGCPPCQGTLLKRSGLFWTRHEFELRNRYIVHRLAEDPSPSKSKSKAKGKARAKHRSKSNKPAKVRGAYSLAELSSVTIENKKEILIKFKSETSIEEAKVFKADTHEEAKRWRDCMKQRMSEMETRSKYLLHWIELPSEPRGLLCLDFDRTLLKEHTFQRANDLAVKGLEKLPLKELVAWFGGQARLDVTKAWLAQLWNEYRVAWVIISLGRTEQVLVIMRRLGLLPAVGTLGLQAVVGSRPCVFGYDKGVSVQECCAKAWGRVWYWAMLQKSRVQELAVFFADDSKRNVDAVRTTCGLSEEQLMFVDKDKAIDSDARAIISSFFSKRMATRANLPKQHTLWLRFPLGGMIGLHLHTKYHKHYKNQTFVQVDKLTSKPDGSPGSAELAGILQYDRVDCIDEYPVRALREVKYQLEQVHIRDPSRVHVKVVVLRLPQDKGAKRSGSSWTTR